MINNPSVDIIIPAYNASQYLSECLISVLRQSYDNISNIIIINDGSTDNTSEVINEFKNSSFKIINNAFPKGVSASRNEGMEISNAQFITFVDSDDIISSEYVYALVRQIQDNILPVIGMTHVSDRLISTHDLSSIVRLNTRETMKEVLGFGAIQGYSCGKLFSMHEIKKHNIFFDEELSICEDLEFVCRYLNITQRKISIVPDPLYFYRIHKNSALTSRKDNYQLESKIISEIKALKKIEKIFTKQRENINSSIVQLKIKELLVLNNSFFYLNKMRTGEKIIKDNLNYFKLLLRKQLGNLLFFNFVKIKSKISFCYRLIYNLIFVRVVLVRHKIKKA